MQSTKGSRYAPWVITVVVIIIAGLVLAYNATAPPKVVTQTSVVTQTKLETQTKIEQAKVVEVRAFIATTPGLIAHSFPQGDWLPEVLIEKHGIALKKSYAVGDQLAIDAVLSGQADIGYTGALNVLLAAQKGAKLKIFNAQLKGAGYQIWAKQGINSPKDLEGKSFAISTPGSLSHVIPLGTLKRMGIDVSKINFVQVGGVSARQSALIGGKVDATMITVDASTALALKKPQEAKILVDVSKEIGDFIESIWFTSDEYAQKNPQIVENLAKGVLEVARRAQNVQEYKSRYLAYYPQADPKWVEETVKLIIENKELPFDGGLTQKSIEFTTNFFFDSGLIKEKPPSSLWIDARFEEKALRDIGPFRR